MSNKEEQASLKEAEGAAESYDPLHHTLKEDSQGQPKPTKTQSTKHEELPPVPGAPVELSTKALDVGKDVLQSFAPLRGVHEHVCGFHFYAHDMTRQVEAHHYCSHPTEEMRQCIIFDSDKPGARLVGIEYIVSERLFLTLPEEEKKMWHSHSYEVSSGTLIAPGVPGMAEKQDMQKLTGTYGKTFHTWQVDRGDALPLGPPQLMMALTADGQVDPDLLAVRDARYGISSADKKAEREQLNYPEKIVEGADHWKSGSSLQVSLEEVEFKGKKATTDT